MGKRELLLIVVFVLIGTAIYHLTAPDSPPSREGWSLGRVLGHVRAALQAEQSKLPVRRVLTDAVPAGTTAIALKAYRGQVTVTGADRADASVTLATEVYGVDDADARAKSEQVRLELRPHGDVLEIIIEQPPSRRRPPQELHIEMPGRLGIRLESRGQVEVQGVAQVDLDTRTADVTLKNIAGSVTGEHRDGELRVTRAGAIDLSTRRAQVTLEDVGGPLTGEIADGRLVARRCAGSIDIETRRTEVEIERPGAGVKLVSSAGGVTVRDPAGAVSFEGQRCRLMLVATLAVPITATTSDATVEARLPPSPAGLMLDLSAGDGRIELPGPSPPIVTRDSEQSAAGKVNGGGPLWKIRTRRGDIILRD